MENVHVMTSQVSEASASTALRSRVRATYDGPGGALLATASAVSGNLAFAERLFRTRVFDLQGLTQILDVGSGAGQLTRPMLKYASPTARIVCSDLSFNMLRRAQARVGDARPVYVNCDVETLPFASGAFDGVTCGFVLEHLLDPRVGLAEIARVLRQGGRLMLLTLLDSLLSTVTAKLWHCHTFSPDELRGAGDRLGFTLCKSIPLTGWQRFVRGEGLAQVWQKR
jgi:2-polyprenyl-3-methyl-5-hydroxy-6-metoxy-1,4-benzoquinol methylase